METLVNRAFWRGRRVFLTGHTGFKGSWMVAALHELGADVHGYALAPEERGLFVAAGLASACVDGRGDVRDGEKLLIALHAARPDVVIHFAARSLVRASFESPAETFAVNVQGTVNLLEACRSTPQVGAIVVATSDKVYRNDGRGGAFVEGDPLGGSDPYSASKAAAELVVASYRDGFFGSGPAVASGRAGNVVGGGDFAADRLIPDAANAFAAGSPLVVRYAHSTRPWQYVLDSAAGYLLLAERLFDDRTFAEAWNFGPAVGDSHPVSDVATMFARHWGDDARWEVQHGEQRAEARTLAVDAGKARSRLNWQPRVALDDALRQSAAWYKPFYRGEDVAALTRAQLRDYFERL